MSEAVIISGLGLGFASTLHCAAMCGGIGCSALLLLGASTPKERYRQLAIMQAGRVTTYAVMGAIFGAIGAALAIPRGGMSFAVMQWAAAVSLMWMGLVLAGALPNLSFLDHGVARLARGFEKITAPLRTKRTVGPYALGVAWGLNACPMLYGAVFFSSLTGSALQGFLFMIGFGIGTSSAVVAAASGLTFLRTINAKHEVRIAAGIVLAIAGVASISVPWSVMTGFCLH